MFHSIYSGRNCLVLVILTVLLSNTLAQAAISLQFPPGTGAPGKPAYPDKQPKETERKDDL